jgi:hypothetical protein
MNSPEVHKIESETKKLKTWKITELRVPSDNDGGTIDIVDFIGSESANKKEILYLHNYQTIESRKELQKHITTELYKQGTRVAVSVAQTNPNNQQIFFRLACTL